MQVNEICKTKIKEEKNYILHLLKKISQLKDELYVSLQKLNKKTDKNKKTNRLKFHKKHNKERLGMCYIPSKSKYFFQIKRKDNFKNLHINWFIPINYDLFRAVIALYNGKV